MSRNLEWCICILFLYGAANVGAGTNRPESKKFVKECISHFRSNKMQFCNYLGRGFNIPEYKGNKFFDPKSLVGSYRDTLSPLRLSR